MSVFCFCCLLWITLFFQDTDAAARFTQVPPSKLYVVKGQTAKLVWSYSVDNRNTEFNVYSPGWFFKTSDVQYVGRDNGFMNWKFQIASNTCPPRLLRPTVRVSRENQATLVIKNVSVADNGTYGCSLALRSASDMTKTTELIVTETPTFTALPYTKTTIIEYSDLIIPCTAVGPPSPNITWLNHVTKKPIVQGIGSAVLRISNVKRSQNGTQYECKASNNPNENPYRTWTTVFVYYPSEITRAPINTTVNQGHDIILHCQATANPPISSISWKRENNVAIRPGFTQLRNSTLIIPNAKRADAGKYICTAWNYFNSKSHKATRNAYVSVKYPPEFTNAPINTTVNQGHDIILHCQATANPPSSIFWQRENNVVIKPGFTLLRNGTLIIPNAERSDAGKYICTAKNIFNSKVNIATSHAYVNVKFLPATPQVTVTNIEASSATIRWTEPLYNGGSPITGYKLISDSKKVEFSKKENEYTVSGLTKDTQYVVRVYARNDVGYSNASSVYFRTKKQGPPYQPIVEDLVVVQTSVMVTWLKPEENGGEITGYTIYKKVDGYSWTQVGQISGTPLTYTVKNLEPGKTYRIIVTAANEFGESVKDDSKAKVVVIPFGTTKVPSTMIKQPECKGSSAQKNYQGGMIAVVVCVCLLVISLIFNILSVVYFYRVKKRSKNTTERTHEPTYDNLEMARSTAPTPSYVNVGITSLPSAEYEPVGHTNTIPSTYEIPGNQHAQTSRDHYQQLNTETMQHDPTVQYEPLRTQHVTTDQRDRLRNRPAVYQNLQKYSNA